MSSQKNEARLKRQQAKSFAEFSTRGKLTHRLARPSAATPPTVDNAASEKMGIGHQFVHAIYSHIHPHDSSPLTFNNSIRYIKVASGGIRGGKPAVP
jgi:hypothetical protein